MKTLKTIAILSLIIISNINVFADGLKLRDEAYIDDIPFNTELIFDSVMRLNNNLSTPEMTEESYINDIPFDTETVVESYRSDSALEVRFRIEDEKPVDDIPFNTREIASRHMENRTKSAILYSRK